MNERIMDELFGVQDSRGNYIHPTALIAPGVKLGTGNIIGPYCIIGHPPEFKGKEDFYGRVTIGDNNRFTGHVTVDSGTDEGTVIGNAGYFMKHCHIGHDAQIDNEVTISCGAKIGGHARVGDWANIGLNAVIHQKHWIEKGCMIGMGAVVTKKLITESFKTYAGNPARLLGDNTKHPNYTIFMKQYPGE